MRDPGDVLSDVQINTTPGLAPSAKALLRTYFFVPELRDRLFPIKTEGFLGWWTNIPHENANVIGWDGDSADEWKTKGVPYFHQLVSRNQPFSFLVGPAGRDAQVEPELRRAGLELEYRMLAMTWSHSVESHVLAVQDDAGVRELIDFDDPRIVQTMAEGFDVPRPVSQLYHDAYTTRPEHHLSRLFGAGEGNTLSALAYMSYLPSERYVLMRAACALPSARNQGLYRKLIGRRLDEALSDGFQSAIVFAAENTSAPLCESMGFERFAHYDVYVRRTKPRSA